MTKTLATFFGIVYALMGALGLVDTGLVGTNGIFAADTLYSIAFLVIGAVLFVGALATDRARSIAMTMGVILALVALSGFLIVPDRGVMFGMLVNSADHWANLVLGLLLAGAAFIERAPAHATATSPLRRYVHARHA